MTDTPKLFTPLTLRGVTLRNRIAVSPMAMYRAEDGYPTDFHRTHYGKFGMGGAGLVFVEETAVTRTGRITNGCLGLWNDNQTEAYRPIAAQLRDQGAVSCMQIAHGGRKSSAQRAWEGNGPLTAENLANGDEQWTPVAPSDNPFSAGWPVPEPLDRAGMDTIRDAFVASCLRALEAGFDMVELHMAHGYLLQSFLSPLANKRTDDYGGSLENRMRFPVEVATAVRKALPDDVPLLARISATDWIDGGWQMDDSVALAKALEGAGVDLIDCSSGGNLEKGATNSNLTRSPGYQAPFAARIRAETGLKSQAVGLIRTPELAEQLLQDGAADIIALGRQMLFNPFWAHHAAEHFGVTGHFENWPKPYAWWLDKWSAGLRSMGEEPLAHG
ncbi:NADH:flavin oxidoreductase/NADH oxidase [Pseudooceanicola sp.]|uniref:NADH:flavin oxidoreductase/NADH oxidase n=1 Tax=Pseudooceanicola sp. TaxID=1914328 RepID=UPI002622299E|nr:NADH:flavin oxidoreductase/NADH oxidase [Pseudooceanicola sp.]MDF1855032.1 NADH:flavin oxidoreductase/NADH oxidase [Pseudooceanicola sp.]